MKKLLALLAGTVVFCSFTACSMASDDSENGTNTTTTAASTSDNTSAPDNNSSQNTPSTKELFDKAKAALGEMPSTVELDEEMFGEYYKNADSKLTVEEYICEIPAMNVHATEIAVVKFSEDVSQKQAEEFFSKRQKSLEQTWEQYLPEQYEIVKNSVVAVNGRYALYCVSENADKAADAFKKG